MYVGIVVDAVPGVTHDPLEASMALMTVVDTPGIAHAIERFS